MNESGYGSWPYILAFDFPADTLVEYGSDAINVEYGNTDGETSISLLNQSPSDETHLYLSITDPALNIDPTSGDKWVFNIPEDGGGAAKIIFASNHTDTNGGNTAISLAERGDMGCSDNCQLSNATAINGIVVGSSGLNGVAHDGYRDVLMTETGSNTATFESWATNGTSQLVTVDEVGGDKKVVFTYGGNAVDMVITYNDASLSDRKSTRLNSSHT